MPLNPSGAISLGGPTVGQSIAVELGLSPTASISLNQTNVRTLAGVPSGTIIMPTNFWGKSNWLPTQQGIIAMGGREGSGAIYSGRQLISSTGVVSATAASAGPARRALCAVTFGGDKAILTSGTTWPPAFSGVVNFNNLVSNTGVVASATANAGTALAERAGTAYGGDRGILLFGRNRANNINVNTVNLISNTGVVAGDTTAPAASARSNAVGVNYGGQNQTAIVFGSGFTDFTPVLVNQISNTGVVSGQISSPAWARRSVCATTFGGDRALVAWGTGRTQPTNPLSGSSRIEIFNYISNTGVVGADVSSLPLGGREAASGMNYGGDKGILMYGETNTTSLLTNLVSNTGVVAAGITSATAPEFRVGAAAAGFSYT